MPLPPPKTNKEVFMRETFRGQFYPKNEYEQATMLIDSELPSEDEIQTLKHSMIVDRHIQTSNIGNDELMAMIQTDLYFLDSMLSMAKRYKGMIAPFNLVFFPWRGGIILSKAKQGMENTMQHATGTKTAPTQFGQGGYGAGLPQYQPEQQKKSITDQIRGIFGSRRS